MQNPEALDLFIVDGEIVLDDALNPVLISGAESLAQDIKHLIIEGGYLIRLVGQRSQARIDNELLRLVIEVENDKRVIPGTASAKWNNGKILLKASYQQTTITVTL
jgi:hypothetical protein